jgi:alkylhydroperoxidase family enzyme
MSFLDPPGPDPEVERLYGEDVAGLGYVMNNSRVWAHDVALHDGLANLMRDLGAAYGLTLRQRAILVTATASARADSYCALAWGARLAAETDPATAAGVLRGDDTGLTPAERTLAAWARQVARDPNATTAADVGALRAAGFTDREIFAITVYIGLRVAFALVNDALGARPDAQLRTGTPAEVLAAVTYGRPVAD